MKSYRHWRGSFNSYLVTRPISQVLLDLNIVREAAFCPSEFDHVSREFIHLHLHLFVQEKKLHLY